MILFILRQCSGCSNVKIGHILAIHVALGPTFSTYITLFYMSLILTLSQNAYGTAMDHILHGGGKQYIRKELYQANQINLIKTL